MRTSVIVCNGGHQCLYVGYVELSLVNRIYTTRAARRYITTAIYIISLALAWTLSQVH